VRRGDLAILLLPFDEIAGFDSVQLHTEGQVALLPLGHPLAKRKTLRTSDLEELPDLPLPRWPELDGTYPDGSGPAVRDYVQLLQLISLGRACAIVPESAPRFGDDLAAVPVLDAERVTTVIAWPPTVGLRRLQTSYRSRALSASKANTYSSGPFTSTRLARHRCLAVQRPHIGGVSSPPAISAVGRWLAGRVEGEIFDVRLPLRAVSRAVIEQCARHLMTRMARHSSISRATGHNKKFIRSLSPSGGPRY
jgi:hypothetical protein